MLKNRDQYGRWWDLAWNTHYGCTKCSPGCDNCWAETLTVRLAAPNAHPSDMPPARADLARRTRPAIQESVEGGFEWSGDLVFAEPRLDIPLRRKTPTVWFVSNMSDLFHPHISDDWRDRMHAVMALCPQHRFVVCTKRADAMANYYMAGGRGVSVSVAMRRAGGEHMVPGQWPLRNVIHMVTCCNQGEVDHNVPLLLKTPSACRAVNVEPLLGSVILGTWLEQLDWVLIGDESGPHRRRPPNGTAEAIAPACYSYRVPLYVKQLQAPHPKRRVIHDNEDLLWPRWAVREYPEVLHGAK